MSNWLSRNWHTLDKVLEYLELMEINLIRAQHYRDQSAKMHELAAKEENHEAKSALTDLALMYARLCEKLSVSAVTPHSNLS